MHMIYTTVICQKSTRHTSFSVIQTTGPAFSANFMGTIFMLSKWKWFSGQQQHKQIDLASRKTHLHVISMQDFQG